MFGPLARNLLPAALLSALGRILLPAIFLLAVALPGPAVAAPANVDGLPLPRFVTTHFNNVNVRVGPGAKYDVAWIFTSAGTPVEVIQEFDIWRKIRDFDGQEGWIQQNQLSGARAGLVSPGKSSADYTLFSRASVEAAPSAYLPSGFRVNVPGAGKFMLKSDEAELLRLAASLERGSEHPLADAILRAAKARGLSLSEASEFDSPVGRGVTGVVDGKMVLLGGGPLMAGQGIDLTPLLAQAEALRQDGTTAVFAAIDGQLAGVLGIADPIKATTAEAVRALQTDGVRLVMMTGDNRTTALAVAKQLGILDVEAEVLPQDKARVVQKLRAEGRVVAMAGDGVNDAPALAAADVGVAMGTGSDVAIESAGVTLLKGDLQGLVRARRLSRAVMRNIRQNLVFAFVYNVAGVPIAAGVLYPLFGQLLSPAIAAAAMALSSVSVISNALRLRVARL